MALPVPVASFRTTITTAISDAATTIPIDSTTDDDGNSLNGVVVSLCLEKGKSREETIIGTVDSANSQLTGCTRGVSVRDGVTAVAGLALEHPAKSPIECTSHPFLALLVRLINGTDSIANLIRYSSDFTPVLDRDIATKGYVDSVFAGGTVTTEKLTIPGNGGETLVAGNLVYLNSADNEWYKCDADTAASVNNIQLGIAQGAGTNGGVISGGVLLAGLDENQSGLSLNTKYYASNTAGGISASAGTTEVTIGISQSATSILFSPRFDQGITEAQQDLLDAITASATEINQLTGAVVSAAQLNEWAAIAAATDISGAELETLSSGASSNADSLHTHSFVKKLSAQTGTVTVSNTATRTELFTASLTGGTLSTNNAVRVRVYITSLRVNTGTLSLHLQYGATDVATMTFNSLTAASTYNGYVEAILFADASASAQRGVIFSMLGRDNGTDGSSDIGTSTGTENSASTLSVAIDAEFSLMDASNSITVRGATFEIIK